jgi:minor extracellular serine protease Vpr
MSRNLVLFTALFCVSLTAQVVIVNNASFRADQPVAAGSWVAAFGAFNGVSTQTATSFPLPRTLASVKVTVDGVDAALFDVRSTQLTFLMPYAVMPGLRPVVISTPAGSINTSVRVISAGPGIFTKDTQNPPRGAIRNQDGFTENAESTPTRRGDVISIYATGPGALSRSVEDGAIPGATPLTNTKSTPQVFIGGVEAQVQFSGLNPDAPGLWQINVTVPDQSFITGRVPVRIFMDGVDSNEVTLFVQ